VADKSNQMVLSALSLAVAHTSGLPLFASKATPGLFPANAAGKQAAQRCQEDGFLRQAAPGPEAAASEGDGQPTPQKKAKGNAERWLLTDKGVEFLFAQVSPRQMLEDLVRVLEVRQCETRELVSLARNMQQDVEALRQNTERVLQLVVSPADPSGKEGGSLGNLSSRFQQFLGGAASRPAADNAGTSTQPIATLVRQYLRRWENSGTSEDCCLPELFRQLKEQVAGLTLGQFHDGLRQMHKQEQVYLHPWTGPLYDLPEPPAALLIGHEVAYYASLRGTSDTHAGRTHGNEVAV